MAVAVRILVEPADRDAHDRLDAEVNARIGERGGPPDGLMAHLSHPEGDGFVLVDVWRSEETFRAWWDDLLGPLLTEMGLSAGEPEITPVWSFARP